MKTHKGAAKRFKITKNGKMERQRAFGNHMLDSKTPDRKRSYSKLTGMASGDEKNIKKMLGA